MQAVLAGRGLAYLPEDRVRGPLARGQLVQVLSDWCAPFSGYHLYYPSRRHAASALAVMVDALRLRG
jgi:DNA-binding transcriptional LysR family regulator